MQTRLLKSGSLLLTLLACALYPRAQKDLPEDYLSAAFHKGRREAARALMPEKSVMVVFAAPVRNFSNDVDYLYHQNPDLYYFTGYKEPNALLLIFKEEQTGSNGQRFNELFFVQSRDELMERWTGRRLGPKGVKEKLGIQQTFDGKEFKNYALNFSGFQNLLFTLPSGTVDLPDDSADLYNLVSFFKEKVNFPNDYDETLEEDLLNFSRFVSPSNFNGFRDYLSKKMQSGSYRSNALLNEIVELKDSSGIESIKEKIKERTKSQRFKPALFKEITGQLREIKTPEEMTLIRKAVEISCAGQNEVIKAVRADMSELEIQGLHEYVHKKYGAEGVGYGSIIGAGENGCILHYMENTKTKVGNDMLLMDVGAEYHGYTADVTRTVPADGKFSPEERAIYQLVYDSQEAAFRTLKDGAKWADASKVARDVIADGLLKLGIIKNKEDNRKYYPHGLSHHIGLDVHDRSYSDTLRKGMVITIEPGIYIPPGSPCDKKWWGIAVRIEDDVLIRENDYELLSHFAPRSIEGIERMIAEKSAVDDFKLPPLKSAQKKAF